MIPNRSQKKLRVIAQRALSSVETVFESYRQAQAAIDTWGPCNLVECGVFAGANSAAMALAVMDAESPSVVWMFDSFQGISEPGTEDQEFIDHGHTQGTSASAEWQVIGHMKEWEIDETRLIYMAGWLSGNPHIVLPTTIHVLRLDLDLYEPTKWSMKFLYPRLVQGGRLIVDDFSLTGCRKAVEEVAGSLGPVYFLKS